MTVELLEHVGAVLPERSLAVSSDDRSGGASDVRSIAGRYTG